MQDPSAGVQPPLDKHVHLLSGHNYPLVAQLSVEQAFRYLLEAPSVVKQVAPMSWTYVNAPQDGTIWLEWLSQGQNSGRFPSDGYVWGDPEQSFRQNFNGYTIELLVHQFGFRPSLDHMTAHARTRYHFVAKAPHVNAAPPDPSLWIVHYHHASQQRILPASQVPVDPYTRQLMNERRWLENQGRIERRDFMLHDREHWPNITIPSIQQGQGGFYAPNGMQTPGMGGAQNRFAQPPYPQPQGPPSAKRQRMQGPGSMTAPTEPLLQDHSVEDEEYTALGDYFDHLTPREISLTRYKQHHRWIEEVFSSQSPSRSIVPVDLGLGLMGELKGLTEGILPAPTLDEVLDRGEHNEKETNAAAFTKIPNTQLEEFNARVQKHIDEGKAEIERMKAEHAAKMREWRKTYKLTQAERQLRAVTWEGHESAMFRPTNEDSSGYSEIAQAVHVEDVVSSVEKLVGLKIKTYADASLVAKGGLETDDRGPNIASSQQAKGVAVAQTDSFAAQQQASGDSQAGAGAAAAAQQQQEGVKSGQLPTQTSSNLPGLMDRTQQPSDLVVSDDPMAIDASDLQFDLDTPAQSEVAGGVASGSHTTIANTNVQPRNDDSNTNPGVHDDIPGLDGNNDADEGDAEQNMFNESNFDFDNELGGTGDDVGEGMVDFGDDDMGIEDSAFGDAIHGMDS